VAVFTGSEVAEGNGNEVGSLVGVDIVLQAESKIMLAKKTESNLVINKFFDWVDIFSPCESNISPLNRRCQSGKVPIIFIDWLISQ
jgi:hypothetical protein